MNKSRKTTRICTLSNHSNWEIFKQTNQKENLMKQIYKKINQRNWETSQNENCEKIIIVSRINLHVICNKKKDDEMTS